MSDLVKVESPLQHADFAALSALTTEGGVVLREDALLGHLNLRGNAQDPEFVAGVAKALGLALPLAPCSSAQNDDTTIMWLSPDEWIILVEGGKEEATEASLRSNLTGHFAVSDISGGQTILELSGDDCIKVLQKSTGYDVHLDNFPVGKVVGTTFAKSSAHIRRTGEQSFQLVIRRSFSDYIWLWLQQSSKEYGLRISR
ncbi:MAG: sarcosine oxidase subunit gamma family protein [Paraglaciecola sp.]|uniref:sarcosine oxidase subunit gamma n=1 Tax=Paraglaciecola sp. TaxID=1920173 RepID=UPI0032989700